jgi:hypothetical protein
MLYAEVFYLPTLFIKTILHYSPSACNHNH